MRIMKIYNSENKYINKILELEKECDRLEKIASEQRRAIVGYRRVLADYVKDIQSLEKRVYDDIDDDIEIPAELWKNSDIDEEW